MGKNAIYTQQKRVNFLFFAECAYYFPQDASKYAGHEKILYESGFGQLCKTNC